MSDEVHFNGKDCILRIRRPSPGVVVVQFTGTDIGEFADAPFREIEKSFTTPIDLFIDARRAKGASVDVSAQWAEWLSANKSRFHSITMLTGSRFIQLSADFVRKFANLGDLMRLTTDPAAFEGALADTILKK